MRNVAGGGREDSIKVLSVGTVVLLKSPKLIERKLNQLDCLELCLKSHNKGIGTFKGVLDTVFTREDLKVVVKKTPASYELQQILDT